MQTKRQFTIRVIAGVAAPALSISSRAVRAAPTQWQDLEEDFATIERAIGGRLGVAVLDTDSGKFVGYRAEERFPMCSTFKLLAAAAVLKRREQGKETLERRVKFEQRDIVVNSAVTKDRAAGDGMTMADLCEAAMTWSDNTAGNLILTSIGGTKALTDYARSLGDGVTRLDRIEPDLNEAQPGDIRDTTSPAAMLKDLDAIALGDGLSLGSKKQLVEWLLANKTGGKRLRAGLPADWKVGDKTGSGEHGTTNDVGIVWPPQRQPLLVAIYLTDTAAGGDDRNRTVASVGSAIAARIRG